VDIPNNAPRCFGFASAYGADDEICAECPAVDQCGPVAAENLIQLGKVVDVGNIGSMHFVGIKPKDSLFKAKTRPMSAQSTIDEMVRRINSCSTEVVAKFSRGENPFSISDKPAYLRPIAAFILKGEGDDDTIIGCLTGKFNLPQYQAVMLCNIVKQSLAYIGAIAECDNKSQEEKE